MQSTFWNDMILAPLRRFVDQALAFLLNYPLAMLVVLVVGVLAALALRVSLRLLLRLIRFDAMCERQGLTALLRTAGIGRTPSAAFARLVYWLVVFVFLMFSLAALNVEPMNDLISQVFLFIPRAIAALTISIFGVSFLFLVSTITVPPSF